LVIDTEDCAHHRIGQRLGRVVAAAIDGDSRSSRARWPLRRAGNLEVAMSSKPKAAKAATTIAGVNPGLIFRPCVQTTDPAVGWRDGGPNEFFMTLDKPTQNKAMAVRLQAEADVYKALASAHSQMADVLKSRG
jgi:hypothetical protein